MAMATYAGCEPRCRAHRPHPPGYKGRLQNPAVLLRCRLTAIFLCKDFAVGLVLGDADPAVTAGALEYLSVMSLLFCFHGLLMIFRNTLQGLGYSMQAVISGIGELVGRSLGGLLAVTKLGYLGICLANPIAWALAMFYCIFMVTRVMKKNGRPLFITMIDYSYIRSGPYLPSGFESQRKENFL